MSGQSLLDKLKGSERKRNTSNPPKEKSVTGKSKPIMDVTKKVGQYKCCHVLLAGIIRSLDGMAFTET